MEENINGYSIKDDLRITETAQEDGERRISALDRDRSLQMVKKVGSKKMNAVLHEYSTTLPEGINDAVQYTRYSLPFDYFLVTADNGAKVREKPVQDSATVASVGNLDKLSLLQRVESDEFQGQYMVQGWLLTATKPARLPLNRGTWSFALKGCDAVNDLKQQVAQDPSFYKQLQEPKRLPPRMRRGGRARIQGLSQCSYFQADTGGDRYTGRDAGGILGEAGDLYHLMCLPLTETLCSQVRDADARWAC